MKIIDISVPVSAKIITWPQVPKPRFRKISDMGSGNAADDTCIEMSLHTGTHIDAPSHFVPGGKTIDVLELSTFVGPTLVVYLPRIKEISASDLEKLNLPAGLDRILIKTSNSSQRKITGSSFRRDYVGLTVDAAEWIAKRRFKLVGLDYLSAAKFQEVTPVHKILLGRGVALLEGIDLGRIKPGRYQLISLPVKIKGVEASFTRAVLTY